MPGRTYFVGVRSGFNGHRKNIFSKKCGEIKVQPGHYSPAELQQFGIEKEKGNAN